MTDVSELWTTRLLRMSRRMLVAMLVAEERWDDDVTDFLNFDLRTIWAMSEVPPM